MSTNIHSVLPKGVVLTAEDGDTYTKALYWWSETSVRRPKYLVQARNADDVSKAIKFASANDLEVAIKGGGHSCSGASASEDIIIDLRKINSVVVDKQKNVVVVGGGALWSEVDDEAAKHGLAVVGGTVNDTGVGGLTLGGGYGLLSPKYGLVIDNLVEVEIVLADGEIVRANEQHYNNLFWGVRGGGVNFGAVTSFTFKAHPQTNNVWAGLLIFPPPAAETLTKALDTWYKHAGQDESVNMFIGCAPPTFTPIFAVLVFYNGSAEEGKKKFSALYEAGPVADMTAEMPYPKANTLQAPMTTPGDRKLFKATTFTQLSPPLIEKLIADFTTLVTEHPEAGGSAVVFEFYPADKIVSVPTTSTAFASRGRHFNINFVPRWKDPALDHKFRAWGHSQMHHVHQFEHQAGNNVPVYANYGFGDERSRDVFRENYGRLTEVKGKYDPKNFFHKWFPIIPEASGYQSVVGAPQL